MWLLDMCYDTKQEYLGMQMFEMMLLVTSFDL